MPDDIEARLTISGRIGSASISSTITRTAPGEIAQVKLLPAAKTGSLTTRTDDDEGSLTLEAGHGITTGATFDLYWSGGRRYNVAAGTVAGNVVPFSGGAGDNLPDQSTTVTATLQTTIDVDFVGNLATMIAANCDNRAHLGFYSDSSLILSVDVAAGEAWFWFSDGVSANPFAGQTVTSMKASQAGTTARKLNLGLLYNSA